MRILADWTTAGVGGLSWLVIVFTLGVIVTLILTAIEQRDAWRTYKAVTRGSTNGGMGVLVESTLFRSMSRICIQIAFLTLACSNIYLSLSHNLGFLYWYRIIFVVTLLGVEVLLGLSVVNDIVARHKLEEYISQKKES